MLYNYGLDGIKSIKTYQKYIQFYTKLKRHLLISLIDCLLSLALVGERISQQAIAQ
jgi:hypothetical protein